jgi:hypothetical protein
MSLQEIDSEESGNSYSFDFFRHLPEIQPDAAKLSAGFLRCRPEKWLPAFSSHWLPFWHSLGIEAKIIEIKTLLKAAKNVQKGFYGVVDDERVAVCVDEDSEQAILSAVSPGAAKNAESLLLEYLARRFFSSMAQSWSAAENAKVQFRTEIRTHSFNESGAVKIAFSLNNSVCNVWLLLGEGLVQKLDGLWRRQLNVPSKEETSEMHRASIELFGIELFQNELEAQLKPGHFIGFSGSKIELVTLIINGKPYLPAKLSKVDEKIALQTASSNIEGTYDNSSKVRLSVKYPEFRISASALNEASQISSVFTTDIDSQSPVELYVQDKKVAEGRLAYFLGNLGVLIS